ncbi:MAG: hypothetical protein JNJ49_17065 [Bdellovibrionaceae bacterium]|nr:hypothetical protein [Pseudobdellovibrionaceae bacterium]
MTIGKRATIGFAIMMFFVLLSSGLSLYLNQRSQESLNVFMDSAKKKDLQAKLERLILDATLGYMDAIVDKDSAAIADEITSAVNSLATEIRSVTAKDVGISEAEWQDFLKAEETYTKQGQLMFSDIRSKRNDRFAEHDDVIDGHSSKMLEMIHNWRAAIDKQAAADNASMNQALAFARDATAVLLVIALIFGSILAYLLSKQINSLLGAVAKNWKLMSKMSVSHQMDLGHWAKISLPEQVSRPQASPRVQALWSSSQRLFSELPKLQVKPKQQPRIAQKRQRTDVSPLSKCAILCLAFAIQIK